MDYADAYLYFPEHDQAPPYLEPGDVGYSLTDDDSTDDYSWSDPEGDFTDDSEGSSIPIHTRYDVDSEIDDSRFSDTPSASSLLEEWNYEFWPTQQIEPAAETPTNTTQAVQCQYSSTDSPVDTSESDSDLPCSAECSRYLINNAADNARADLAAACFGQRHSCLPTLQCVSMTLWLAMRLPAISKVTALSAL